MSNKHEREPWVLGGCSGRMVTTPSGYVGDGYIADVDTKDNARRIVACVNACRGLPTDELEQKGVVAAVGTQLLELESQRDELLAALEEGRRAIGEHFAPNDCYATGPMTGDDFRDLVQCPACSFIAMYDEVITKAKGGAT
ncbi:hypothetical protein [Aeromonas hydrophila]|uniref:hypothetical protein n=1 Tax=Aeromonas hydrophila TaxID=644 RepID=UPI00259F5F04|nr:hypothetical protein [Aeromonas hydrophila]MDM5117230.1 hypothetical protein [Aeromonas hydrophila]